MTELTAEQKARAMMGYPAAIELPAEHLAAKLEALRARGEPFGLSPEQVRAADLIQMSVARYAAYRNVLTIADAEAAEAKLKADAAAGLRAVAELAVERAKAALP